MVVIRRLVDHRRAYTGIFLRGEPPQIFPTSDYEHARILQIYRQDRYHEGIVNDFSDDPPPPPENKQPAAKKSAAGRKKSPRAHQPRPRGA